MTTQNIYDLVDTWNDGATTFTAVKMNVTDTASAAASLLMDLQIGSVSAFNVSKGGSLKLGLNTSGTNVAASNVIISGPQGTGTGAGGSIVFQVAPAGGSGPSQNALATALTIDSTKSLLLANNSTSSPGIQFAINGGYYASVYGSQYAIELGLAGVVGGTFSSAFGTLKYLISAKELTFGAGSSAIGVIGLDAANTLALRNGTAAQEMRVYETTTGTIYKAILGNRQLIKIAGAAFDNGAGASAGTITNAPAVGNPTKWIPIDDNGTTRHIPAW